MFSFNFSTYKFTKHFSSNLLSSHPYCLQLPKYNLFSNGKHPVHAIKTLEVSGIIHPLVPSFENRWRRVVSIIPWLLYSQAQITWYPSNGRMSKGRGKGKGKVKGKGKGRGKGKVHPRTGHEGTQGEKRYSSTPSLTSPLDGWVVIATPRPLYPRKRPGTRCIGGWVGLTAGLDGCGTTRLHQGSMPGPSRP